MSQQHYSCWLTIALSVHIASSISAITDKWVHYYIYFTNSARQSVIHQYFLPCTLPTFFFFLYYGKSTLENDDADDNNNHFFRN